MLKLLSSIHCTTAPLPYGPFIRTAKYALDKLNKLKARRILPYNDDDDDSNVLFHYNVPIKQTREHQGVESQLEPVIFDISHTTARHVLLEGGEHSKRKPSISNPAKQRLFSDIAFNDPWRFQWTDVLSMFEFKCSAKHNMNRPTYGGYDPFNYKQYMAYGRKVVQPTGSTSAAIPTQSASKERKPQSISPH